MINIKTPRDIDKMRRSGEIVALTLRRLSEEISDGITTAALDRIADEMIRSRGAVPSFKNYRGFPKSICTSVNNMVIHGIPGKTRLKSGDIISIDIGAYKDGYHGDSANTFPVGNISPQAQRLIDVAKESFYRGIEQAVEGRRTSDISSAVQTFVEAQGFSVVQDWTGHGIGQALHEDPEIPNFGKAGRGARLYRGMTLAIEPMINAGDYQVYTAPDGWAIYTTDGSLSAHYEHTIAVTSGKPLILTELN